MDKRKQTAALINQALGLFVLFFGIVVVVAVFFTPTDLGKKTNLVAGLILCAIGAVMLLLARKNLQP